MAKTPPSAAKKPPRKAPRPAGPLAGVFDGACSLDIPDAPARVPLDHYPLVCDIVVSADRTQVSLTGFEPISTEQYQARVGPVTVTNSTTVKLRSSKTGQLSRDGHFSIPVVLHFDHLFDMPFYEEDSDLAITLTTRGTGGEALSAAGWAVLVGEGRFLGGALDGYPCHMVYQGRLSPMPW